MFFYLFLILLYIVKQNDKESLENVINYLTRYKGKIYNIDEYRFDHSIVNDTLSNEKKNH